MPTNVEMMADFTETSRQYYIATFNAISATKTPVGLIGKSLIHLYAEAVTIGDESTKAVAGSIGSERLKVDVLGEKTLRACLKNPALPNDLDQSAIDYRGALAAKAETTLIDESFDINDVLGPGIVDALYTAYDWSDDEKRRVFTLDDRPSKANIASGKYLAEQALQCAEGRHREVFGYSFAGRSDGLEALAGRIGFHINSELPLNGHEPRTFLLAFRASMQQGIQTASAALERMKALDAPKFNIDRQKQLLASRQSALKRVNNLFGH